MADKQLRTGFSTGAAAAAATKAAVLGLLGSPPREVTITLPGGESLTVEVHRTEPLPHGGYGATVIKDAGDDPDVTHKAAIAAEVRLLDDGGEELIILKGGRGVGVVTRPGLDLEVGGPAINPVPRRMIRQAARGGWDQAGDAGKPLRVEITIIVPKGRELAKKTLNPRLGIVGGISILGTTGLVKPFSHSAYTATINSGLKVAKAMGLDEVVLTTGRRSEKRAMAMRPDLPEVAFIQMADFFFHAMQEAAQQGLAKIGLVSFFGKAVKQAQAHSYTHAHKVPMDLAMLSRWLKQGGADDELARQVAEANTARHALEMMRGAGRLDLAPVVGRRMLAVMRRFAGPAPSVWAVMIDYDYTPLFKGELPGGRAA